MNKAELKDSTVLYCTVRISKPSWQQIGSGTKAYTVQHDIMQIHALQTECSLQTTTRARHPILRAKREPRHQSLTLTSIPRRVQCLSSFHQCTVSPSLHGLVSELNAVLSVTLHLVVRSSFVPITLPACKSTLPRA